MFSIPAEADGHRSCLIVSSIARSNVRSLSSMRRARGTPRTWKSARVAGCPRLERSPGPTSGNSVKRRRDAGTANLRKLRQRVSRAPSEREREVKRAAISRALVARSRGIEGHAKNLPARRCLARRTVVRGSRAPPSSTTGAGTGNASVGTSVRERKYDVIIAKTTAIASGNEERASPAPVMNATGNEDDADAQRRDERRASRSAGAPSTIAGTSGFRSRHVAMDVLDLDGRVVDEDADGERTYRRASVTFSV